MRKARIAPVAAATSVDGTVGEFNRLNEQARLPHHSVRERHDLERQAGKVLRDQLGSQDYLLIGEVYGGGNARTSIESLRAALCKKAAAEGGDVVLFFRQGNEDRAYAYSTPGYSQTNVYGTTHRVGNYAYGNATANTIYAPGQTYSGTLHLPFANGLVFRYIKGIEARRERLDALSDDELVRMDAAMERLWQNEKLSLPEFLAQWDALFPQARD